MFGTTSKTVPVTKEMVREAYRKVKKNQGAAGVDRESLEMFQENLSGNLYALWNRLSSGSYFPKPVRSVHIPKANGKQRLLGIPTVSDRIAQQVVKEYLEPRLEAEFQEGSYGYRPMKGQHHALTAVQGNVRQYAWAIDMDIKNFFDEVDHDLLMKALDRHVPEKWAKMYIKRWLESPAQQADGTLTQKEGKGTPQGGVISPLLANLFLHYVLDKWFAKHHPGIAFVRYADDVVVHCKTEAEAKQMLEAIRSRLSACKLSLNEEKTKMVYCRDYRREQKNGYAKKFDFLGFTFKPRTFTSKRGGLFTGYACAISPTAKARIIKVWKELKWHQRSELTVQDIADQINPQMRGIIRYYGKFNPGKLQPLMMNFGYRLAKWVLNKYKRFKGSYGEAYKWIAKLRVSYPNMFYHWAFF